MSDTRYDLMPFCSIELVITASTGERLTYMLPKCREMNMTLGNGLLNDESQLLVDSAQITSGATECEVKFSAKVVRDKDGHFLQITSSTEKDDE